MSTWYGIGTRYMGVVPADDESTSLATKWFVLVGLPILPLCREKIVLGRIIEESTSKSSQTIDVIERVPFSFSNAFRTWFLSWFVVVPLLLWPLALSLISAVGYLPTSFFGSDGWFLFNAIWMVFALVGVHWIHDDPAV